MAVHYDKKDIAPKEIEKVIHETGYNINHKKTEPL
jgi:hypothetical protein